MAAAVFAGAFVLNGTGLVRGPCLQESNYYCIQVRDAQLDRGPAASLVLDRLVHSRVSPINPMLLGYSYLRIYAGVTESVVSAQPAPRVLFVGGGAYGFPRYLEAKYPESSITVVEIDPQVTEISHRLLGLGRDTRIESVHMDARAFLIDWSGQQRYDLVYGDAYSDLSAPYHLTTLEYDRLVYRALTEDGVYMSNIIDDYEHGSFLRAFVTTVREVFGNVYLVRQGTFTGGQAETAVVIASKKPLDLRADAHVADGMVLVAESDLEAYLAAGRRIVLTDDYAPVDQLTVGLFLQRERVVDAPR
jgi:spermidine synthase